MYYAIKSFTDHSEQYTSQLAKDILSPTEFRYYADLRMAYKEQYVYGAYLLKTLYQTHIENKLLPEINVARSAYGKPVIADKPLFVSISHSNDNYAAALSKDPVGIDIERFKPRNHAFLAYIATPEEYDPFVARYKMGASTVIWTIKEACMKADSEIYPLDHYKIHGTQGVITVKREKQMWRLTVSRRAGYVFSIAQPTNFG